MISAPIPAPLPTPMSVAPRPAVMQAEGLGKTYGSITVLSDVTIDILPGEVHAVIGENGAGKSTLMKLLSGHARPTAGHLMVDGMPVDFDDAAEAEAASRISWWPPI